ncbi:hypothetical protein V2J09_021432 [Rumex salicifolius]
MSLHVHGRQAISMGLILIIFCVIVEMAHTEREVEVGYGYRVHSVMIDPYGWSLNAFLGVIRHSNVYGPDIHTLTLTATFERNYRLRIKITDATKRRWEIPDNVIQRGVENQPNINSFKPLDDFDRQPHTVISPPKSDLIFTLYHTSPFGFTVIRRSTNDTLFDTRPTGQNSNPVGLVFKDQFIQLSSSLPAERANLYGLGEHTKPTFKLARNQTLTLWATDIGSYKLNCNLYGFQPVYMDVRAPTGHAHTVLFLNSNGMDVDYTGDSITFKTIGGIVDLYFFAGPKPEEVMQQYTEFIGKPAPMPYWSFGLHQCRYGYKNLKELESVVDQYSTAGIPLEGIWTDLDYMDNYKDFTFSPTKFPVSEMQRFVRKLHKNGQKYVVIIDPGLNINSSYGSYLRGMKANAFVKYQGKPYKGEVWPGLVHFPDFHNPATINFWSDEVKRFLDMVPVDGLWTDMNEPTDFLTYSTESPLDNPPYKINNAGTKTPIIRRTIPMSAYTYNGNTEYNVHNLYGHMESRATNIALTRATGKRPFVLARSTFPGSGKFAAHWLGDNAATWNDMAYTIPSMLNFGIFGIPMVGSDLCGFHENTTEELCQRWTQLGSFYPFTRDHFDINVIRRELYQWPSVTQIAKKVFGLRFRLLPYYYTLMYEAHTKGTPIARPLFFSYPEDPNTYNIDSQFLIGKSLLVSPVLKQGETSVEAYFPRGNWFNLFDYSNSVSVPSGTIVNLSAPRDQINAHIREGNILALQGKGMTTQQARNTPFELLVVVSNDTSKLDSSGSVFLDNGVDIEMGGKMTGKWSLVKFCSSLEMKNKISISSDVVDGRFALSRGWIINKITILGMKKGVEVKGCTIREGKGKTRVVKESGIYSFSIENDDFQVVVIPRLSLLIGKKFKIEVLL